MLRIVIITVTILFVNPAAFAQDVLPEPSTVSAPKQEYSPFVGQHYPDDVLFGDTHLHTSWSTDAGMVGTTVSPDEAYHLAKGGTITSSTGWQVKLIRPLDFVLISDHAENLGLADLIRTSDPLLLANEQGKKWHDMVKAGDGYEAFIEWVNGSLSTNTDLLNEPKMTEYM